MRTVYKSFFALEFKRWMGYRVDFWLQFFVNLALEVTIAYFLWQSIYQSQDKEIIGGFTFDQMLLYYIFGSFVGKMVRTGDELQISREIYEGTITKFLIYPISTLFYKLIVKFSYSALSFTQFILCLLVLPFLLDTFSFDLVSFLAGTFVLVLSIVLAFYLNLIVESIAFWADNVWTLVVMLRFVSQFLGGAFLPISLFPEKMQELLLLSPFPYTYYLPIKIFMGDWAIKDFIQALLFLVVWIAIFALIAKFVWQRGQLRYTGAGQ